MEANSLLHPFKLPNQTLAVAAVHGRMGHGVVADVKALLVEGEELLFGDTVRRRVGKDAAYPLAHKERGAKAVLLQNRQGHGKLVGQTVVKGQDNRSADLFFSWKSSCLVFYRTSRPKTCMAPSPQPLFHRIRRAEAGGPSRRTERYRLQLSRISAAVCHWPSLSSWMSKSRASWAAAPGGQGRSPSPAAAGCCRYSRCPPQSAPRQGGRRGEGALAALSGREPCAVVAVHQERSMPSRSASWE